MDLALLLLLPLAQTLNADYAPQASYQVADSQPYDLVAADFNHDGRMDLAAGSAVEFEVTILTNLGGGVFNDDPFLASITSYGLVAGDFNNDGWADLALLEGSQPNRGVALYFNAANGSMNFLPGPVLTAGVFPIAGVSGDFNQDGLTDLAVAANVSQGVTVFLGTGGGQFNGGQAVGLLSSGLVSDIVRADVDGDADVDLAICHHSGVDVLINDGAGFFTKGQYLYTGVLMEGLEAADLDLDGTPDLVALETYGNVMDQWRGRGDGTFDYVTTLPTGNWTRSVVATDANADGVLDLVLARESSNLLEVLLNRGDGTFAARQSFATGSQPRQAVSADLDGDGMLDLAVSLRNAGQTGGCSVLLNRLLGPDPYQVLPAAVAGSQGLPLLTGQGAPTANATMFLDLQHAAATAAVTLVGGLARRDRPVLDGILLPRPDRVFPVGTTDSLGELSLGLFLPSSLSAGQQLFLQALTVDSFLPGGYSFSNGLQATLQ